MKNIFDLESPVSFCPSRKGVDDLIDQMKTGGTVGGFAGSAAGLTSSALSAGSAPVTAEVAVAAARVIGAGSVVGAAVGVVGTVAYAGATALGADSLGESIGGAIYKATN